MSWRSLGASAALAVVPFGLFTASGAQPALAAAHQPVTHHRSLPGKHSHQPVRPPHKRAHRPAKKLSSGYVSAAPQFKSSSTPLVLGYYVPGQSALSDLQAHASQINAIAPFWYSLRINGTLHDMGSSAGLTNWAHSHHIAVYPMVINGYGNDNVLQNPGYFSHDVAALTQLAANPGYAGLNIDFESLNNNDEVPLNHFVADVAAALHQEGKKLIVSVGPRTSDQNGYYVYNYRSLGASADYIDLMLYDQHENGGSPGPVAALGWTQAILNYARQTIPASKILVGLAGYGYNWASTGSTELNDYQALALASRYGSQWIGGNVQEPRVTYSVGGVRHIVWFEDGQSEAAKAKWVSQYHLGGIALWDLGEENAGVWPMLKAVLP
jgi:spore germination protein